MSHESLQKKWEKILNEESHGKIEHHYRRAVTAVLLENQQKFLKETNDATSAGTVTGSVSKWDPVMISLVRRAAPNLMAFDVCGVQPMTGPTGLIFALRAKYMTRTSSGVPVIGSEALYNEADTDFTGTGTHQGASDGFPTDFFASGNPATGTGFGTALPTATGEKLGTVQGTGIPEMMFTIDKTTAEAKTRKLKAEYSTELSQDLKAIHGLDAETELAAFLANEILAEINRETIRTINVAAKVGAQSATMGNAANGIFDLSTDADGRWSVERWKGLMFHIEREANQIAKDTRRGRGNVVICSSDVAAALNMAGILQFAPALNNNLIVDDTGNTFAGVLNGRIKVYIDPYATTNYLTVGYRGATPWDAGVFYCPYVPLQMMKAIGEDSFQPKLGFSTRYALKASPFALGLGVETNTGNEGLAQGSNIFYRKMRVNALLQ